MTTMVVESEQDTSENYVVVAVVDKQTKEVTVLAGR